MVALAHRFINIFNNRKRFIDKECDQFNLLRRTVGRSSRLNWFTHTRVDIGALAKCLQQPLLAIMEALRKVQLLYL
jgi:hypothetical protein